ncbi:MAG: tripartite tricarboxylate transporter substrate binding protein BugE [Betaproteobacteria bacterium]|nr:tripartite tricarboxylate transporter substrate binding protein BugE [Betaproteobacteria bacterium]
MGTPFRLIATAVLAACLPLSAAAQAWPTKPIRLVVPFAPGGTTDIVARILTERLSKELGQVVVVENRAGSGGMIGADLVAKAAPDGYILGVATVSTLATIPATTAKMPYDPVKDFSLIINLVTVPNVMTVNPKNVPVKDMKEFIALVKKNPGKYSFASSGTGGISHLDGELFKALTGTFIVHIPYRGSGPALNDAIAGQVDIQMDNLPSSIPHIKAGRLHALAVMSDKRIPDLPDVPTFAEVGLKEANNVAWYGLVGPAGLAPEIVTKVNTAANAALKDPQVIARFAEGGSIAAGGTPQQFAQNAARELALRRDIVKKQKITLD